MSNQRLMKAKEKAGDGYAKTNAIASPPAPLPVGEGREPANPLPSQREMALNGDTPTLRTPGT